MRLLVAVLCFIISTMAAAADYAQWKASHQQRFANHLSEQQQRFISMLEKDWAEFRGQPAEPRDPKPKPVTPPVKDVPLSALPQPPAPPAPAPLLPPPDNDGVLVFMGHRLTPPPWQPELPATFADEQAFASAYASMAESVPPALLSWLSHNREALAITDWGVWQLVQQLAERTSLSAQQQVLMHWFLLLELGHDVRIGFSDQRVALLVSVAQHLYGVDYYTLNGVRYYDLGKATMSKQSLRIHGEQEYPQPLDFAFTGHPKTVPQIEQRVLRNGEDQLILEFDRELAEYYRDHPALALKHYFQAPLSDAIERSLRQGWLAMDARYSDPVDKVNALMRLVQFGVPYALDDEQFGKEYYQLPEELLFYPAGDCEDRAIFFSKAVKHLFQIDAVGLVYPGHVAAAVALPGSGDTVNVAGRPYLMADPTYIGSWLGDTMPKYRNQTPEIIRF